MERAGESIRNALSWPGLFVVAGFFFMLGAAAMLVVVVAAIGGLPGLMGGQSAPPPSSPSEAVTDAPGPDNTITTLPADPDAEVDSGAGDDEHN